MTFVFQAFDKTHPFIMFFLPHTRAARNSSREQAVKRWKGRWRGRGFFLWGMWIRSVFFFGLYRRLPAGKPNKSAAVVSQFLSLPWGADRETWAWMSHMQVCLWGGQDFLWLLETEAELNNIKLNIKNPANNYCSTKSVKIYYPICRHQIKMWRLCAD